MNRKISLYSKNQQLSNKSKELSASCPVLGVNNETFKTKTNYKNNEGGNGTDISKKEEKAPTAWQKMKSVIQDMYMLSKCHSINEIAKDKILNSEDNKYQMLQFLGRGTYGIVVKCRKLSTNENVAIKIINEYEQGQIEISNLQLLKGINVDECNIVKFYEHFHFKNHTFVVYEMLQENLQQFVEERNIKQLPLTYMRLILQQILIALQKLKEIGIIHADLKPDNIMMVDPVRQPYRVKLIDFGCAITTENSIYYQYLQTRFYRAPEIILGLPFCEKIDIWSLGCIAAELFIGWPLYPGTSEYHQLRLIIESRGIPTTQMLNDGFKTRQFFNRQNSQTNFDYSYWKLKTPDEYEEETGIATNEWKKFKFASLHQIGMFEMPIHLSYKEMLAEKEDRVQFTDLLKEMLAMDQSSRISPEEALGHSFVTLHHLTKHRSCSNVNLSFEVMMKEKDKDQ